MSPADENPTDPTRTLEEPDDFKAMLAGAGLIFVLTFVPFASLACCLPQVGAALLAVHLFTSRYSLTLTPGTGIRLGIFTCLMGALASWAAAMGLYFLLDYQVGAKESQMIALKIAEMAGGQQAVEQVRQALEQQRAQGMGMGTILASLLVGALMATLSGVLGGALGATFFKRGPQPPKP